MFYVFLYWATQILRFIPNRSLGFLYAIGSEKSFNFLILIKMLALFFVIVLNRVYAKCDCHLSVLELWNNCHLSVL